MTDRMSTPRRALLVAVAVLGTAGTAAAQAPVEWERYSFREYTAVARVFEVGFLDGPEPGADSLVWFSDGGPLIYRPGHPDNGEQGATEYGGDWKNVDPRGVETATTGIVTSAQTVVWGGYFRINRYVGVQPYEHEVSPRSTNDLHQSALPALRNADGHGALFGGHYQALRSDDDGRGGSWQILGDFGGEMIALGEVPPSAALPGGRLLAGLYNGVTYSDDGGHTWRPGEGAYGFARYLAYSFAFVPEPGHPYGGAVVAAVDDLEWGRDSTATIYRSDDGGGSWVRVHRFRPSAYGLSNSNRVELLALPDGTLWAGVMDRIAGPPPYVGAVARSADGGATWEPVGVPGDREGHPDLRRNRYADPSAFPPGGWGGYRVYALVLGPDGRVYAGTDQGVWRTVEQVFAVAGEGGPSEKPAPLAVRVYPNPTGGAATVEVSGPAERVRVAVFDVRGREVAVLHDGPAAEGQRWAVETAGLAPGAYVVRVSTASGAATAALTVVR